VSSQYKAYSKDSNADPEALRLLIQVRDPGRVADIIAPRLRIPIKDRQILLATIDPVARLEKTLSLMGTNA